MASNVIPFESAKLPAFLSGATVSADDLTANVGNGFAVLSVEGKQWAVKRGKEHKETLMVSLPNGDAMPTASVEVVIVKASKNFSKVWYEKAFVPGTDAKPDCASGNGVTPDVGVANPQAKTCAACPKNVWGSKINEGSESKGKACSDTRRVAVAPAGQLNDPMLLRIPPATLKPLAEYGNMLKKRGVPYNAVVTKMKFDPEMPTPKLEFSPVRFLTEAEYADVTAALELPVIDDILAANGLAVDEAPAEAHTPTAAPVKATPAKRAARTSVVTEAEVETILEPEAAPEKAKTPPASTRTVTVDFDDDLDALLGTTDD